MQMRYWKYVHIWNKNDKECEEMLTRVEIWSSAEPFRYFTAYQSTIESVSELKPREINYLKILVSIEHAFADRKLTDDTCSLQLTDDDSNPWLDAKLSMAPIKPGNSIRSVDFVQTQGKGGLQKTAQRTSSSEIRDEVWIEEQVVLPEPHSMRNCRPMEKLWTIQKAHSGSWGGACEIQPR